jgi:hypothetical protein
MLDVGDWSFGLSVAEILEIRCHPEVVTPHKLDDSLEFVFLFSRDPDLLVLQLALHLEALCLDRLNNFFCFVSFEALYDFQFLPGMTNR